MKEAIILQSIDSDTALKIKIDGIIYNAVEESSSNRPCTVCAFKLSSDDCQRVPGWCASILRADYKNIIWIKQDES